MIYDAEVQTLADLVRVQARRFADRPAITCEDSSVTYAELAARAERQGRRLHALEIQPGARVAILAKDSIDYLAMLFAVVQRGATLVPLNWRLDADDISYIVENAGCQALFVDSQCQKLGQRAAVRCPLLPVTEAADDQTESQLDTGALAAPGLVTVNPSDTAIQMYTSGTTGRPKGVQLPHDSFFAIAREFHKRKQRWIGWSPDDVSLNVVPMFHIGGLWWMIRGLSSGAHNVLLPQFVGWQAIEAIERHRVTKAAMVPAMIRVTLSEPDAEPRRFQSLKTMIYGGSPISPALLREAIETLGCDMVQIYGLTETGNMAVCLPAEQHANPARLLSAGTALPGVELEVIDTEGRPVPPGVTGEVRIKSPARMTGYWNQPEATAATLRDGWIYTGDAGHLDEEGYLYISDRIKDMICCAGENVYPAEIERVLLEHPAVSELAVIGVPHEQWGEAIKAVAVLRPGAELSIQELRSFARDRLAAFRLPSSLDIVESLPRTPSGKVRKQALRAQYWANQARRVN